MKSPSDGKIQSVNSAENADDKTFITIRQTGNFRIKGYVNETNRSSLHEGMEVVIRSRVDDVVQKGTIKIRLEITINKGYRNSYLYQTIFLRTTTLGLWSFLRNI